MYQGFSQIRSRICANLCESVRIWALWKILPEIRICANLCESVRICNWGKFFCAREKLGWRAEGPLGKKFLEVKSTQKVMLGRKKWVLEKSKWPPYPTYTGGDLDKFGSSEVGKKFTFVGFISLWISWVGRPNLVRMGVSGPRDAKNAIKFVKTHHLPLLPGPNWNPNLCESVRICVNLCESVRIRFWALKSESVKNPGQG